MWFFIFLVYGCSCKIFELNTLDALMYPKRRVAADVNLDQTFFSSLENYQVNAKSVTETEYPWIARIVHSKSKDYPYVGTASCISERIFVTAARSIYSLKVAHTSVIYTNHQIPVLAFVLPSNGTKQAFDDIGLVVVEKDHYGGTWATIDLINRNRTGNGFQWFDDWNLSFGPTEFKVIGYAANKGKHRLKTANSKFLLSELDVIISMKICTTILTFKFLIQGFFVPCYHSCSLHQFEIKDKKCTNYHGVEGGAVIDAKSKKLLGVATWGPRFPFYELPVGFSVPNSDNFYRDFECAKRIRNDVGILVSTGYYQSLCPDDNR